MNTNNMAVRFGGFIVFWVLLTATKLVGQEMPIGEWRSYLTYKDGVAIAEGERGHLYLGAAAGILDIVDASETYTLNKLTGLSDMGISTIEYNHPYKALLIAYKNGNFDVYYPENKQTVNLPAIFQNNSVLNEKRVRRITCDSNLVYLSCAFGLVILDMDILEFSQTTFTNNVAVNSCVRYQNALFMATDNGIYKGILDGRNLQDFNIWDKQNSTFNLPNTYISSDLIDLNNVLYADVNDTLFSYNTNTQDWQHIPCTKAHENNIALPYCTPDSFSIDKLSCDHQRTQLLISTKAFSFHRFTPSTSVLARDTRYSNFQVRDVCVDSSNRTWVADGGGFYFAMPSDVSYAIYNYNSPLHPQFTRMITTKEGVLWATNSALDYVSYFFDPSGFCKYDNGTWTNFSTQVGIAALTEFRDAISIAYNSKTKDVFVGSFIDGLLQIDKNNNYIFYNHHASNTPMGLQPVSSDTNAFRVTGLMYDDDNNLWISCHLATRPIVVRKADGSWKSFTTPYDNGLSDIAIDRNGYKWICQERGGNLLVFDEGAMDDDTDNKYFQLTTNNSNLASSGVNCVVADREGTIWVGTDDGVTIFSCGQSVFDGDCVGNRPVVNPDNFNAHLLEGENIQTIAVDGANRKWIGTNNGVFVLSDDGYQKLAYFNVENSPLFDNSVNQIAIDGKTGVVYLSTARGLQAIRGEATTAKVILDKKQAYAFPNPVRPDYTGVIAIANLPEDANVKITDISGRLVYETYALGGQAIWSGNDYNGRRASSGVYLVYVVSPKDPTQKLATKIAFIH